MELEEMMKQLIAVAIVVASGLASLPNANAGRNPPPVPQPEFSCFNNSWTLAQYTGCHFVGENVPNATLTTGNGTYQVFCTGGGGCNFTFTPRNPFSPPVIEP